MKMTVEDEVKVGEAHQEDTGGKRKEERRKEKKRRECPGLKNKLLRKARKLGEAGGAYERSISGGAHCKCPRTSKSLAEKI